MLCTPMGYLDILGYILYLVRKQEDDVRRVRVLKSSPPLLRLEAFVEKYLGIQKANT